VAERPPSPPPIGRRGILLLSIATAGAAAWIALGLSPADLVPRARGAEIAREFFAAALAPALTYEAEVPPGTPPFLLALVSALARTVVFAAAAMSLALLAGLPLGFAASGSWWRGRGRSGRALQTLVRIVIALMRSVHELLWAVIFLAAFGLNTASAVIAIAIPFAGTLAKVFSEMLDEAPRDTADALRGVGAAPAQEFLFGLLPRALPDMSAYAFYRLECAVRSAAVLGFFGYQTVGYFLRLSSENLHYREVWSYLYGLALLVLLLEAWSGALRRRFTA
jgi:phosphonate transport system permease protein